MKRSSKQKLLFGLAAVLVLAGITMAAVTAARPTANRPSAGPLASAADYLGLSTAQLGSDLGSGKSLAQIADATSGKSASGLIEALVASDKARLATALANVHQRVERQVNKAGGPGGAGGPLRRQLPTALYLGIKPAQLRSQLHAGKTLAQIADATSGKSAAGLIEALVSARKAMLAERVAAGKMTPSQEKARLAKLSARVTAAVNRVRPGLNRGRRGVNRVRPAVKPLRPRG
jgi:hypothetical protein